MNNQNYGNNGFPQQNQNFMNNQNQGYPQQGQQQFEQQSMQNNQGYPQQGQQQFDQGYQQQQQQFQNQPPQNNQGYPQQGYSAPIPQDNVHDFTAETAGLTYKGGNSDNYEKNPNTYNVPNGMQVGRIYKIVDLGTHDGFKEGSVMRKIRLQFEFPQYLQQFNLKSPDIKPTSLMFDTGFFTSSKSTLRKIVNSVCNKTLSDDEMKKFNYSELLGKLICIKVESSDDGKYANAKDFMPAAGSVLIPQEFNNPQIPRNPYTSFALGPNAINLTRDSFANLGLKDRKDVIASLEAIDFLNKGGIVFRNSNNEKDNFYNKDLAVSSNNQNQGYQQQAQPMHSTPQNSYQGGFGNSAQGSIPQAQPPQNNQGYPQQQFEQNQQFQQHPPQNQGYPQQGQQQFQQQPNQAPQHQSFEQYAQGQPQQQFDQNQQMQQQAPQNNQGYPQQQAPQVQVPNQGQPQQKAGGFSMGNDDDDDLPF